LCVSDQLLDHPAHVALVVDRVLVGAAEQMRVLAQQPSAHRVEGGGRDLAGPLLSEKFDEPQPQLARRADAERHGEHLVRVGLPRLEQVGDPVGQGPGLAGPGAGDQEQRASPVGYGLGLFGRQPLEQPVCDGRRDAPNRMRQTHHLLVVMSIG
jgi:hypothetical protein